MSVYKMKFISKECINCEVYKNYQKESFDQFYDPFKDVFHDVVHFMLIDNIFLHTLCYGCKSRNRKMFDECNCKCLHDEETDKFVLECCKYYLHRLENCWECSEEENKKRIKSMAKKILNNLSCYGDAYANNSENVKKEIEELKQKYQEILGCDVSET